MVSDLIKILFLSLGLKPGAAARDVDTPQRKSKKVSEMEEIFAAGKAKSGGTAAGGVGIPQQKSMKVSEIEEIFAVGKAKKKAIEKERAKEEAEREARIA